MPKAFQIWAEIDVKTHSKLIQEVIAKKGVKIMKNIFSWKGKNLILNAEHYTVVQKQGSRGLVAERCPCAWMMENHLLRKEINNKSIPKSMQDRWEICAKSILEKVRYEIWKHAGNETRKGMDICENEIKNEVRKISGFGKAPWPPGLFQPRSVWRRRFT